MGTVIGMEACLQGLLSAFKTQNTFAETLTRYSAVSLRFPTPPCGGKAPGATSPHKTQVCTYVHNGELLVAIGP